jgi:hypothetical protein
LASQICGALLASVLINVLFPEQVGLGAGVDGVVSTPVTVADLEALLDLPVEERQRRLPAPASPGLSWAAVPATVGATMIAVAVLMIG